MRQVRPDSLTLADHSDPDFWLLVRLFQVTGNMTNVVKGMDKAMETMNLDRVRTSPSSIPITYSAPFLIRSTD